MGQIGFFTNVTGIAEDLICMTLVPDQKLGRVADAIKFLMQEKEESAYESVDAFLEHQEFLIKSNFQDAVDFVLDKEDNLKDVLKECLDILGDLKRNKLTAFPVTIEPPIPPTITSCLIGYQVALVNLL